jgi:branched-chain amino acid transport system substrate-binding protein
MQNKKFLRVAFALVVIALALAPFGATNAQEGSGQVIVPAGSTIKIGWGGDRSGPLIRPGEGTLFGAQAAVNMLNAEGGIEGFQVELIGQDDACAPETGTTVAQQFSSNPEIVAVVGHMCSGATNGAAAVYEEFDILNVSYSATASNLTTQDRQAFNRVALNDNAQGTALARYMYNDLGLTTAAVLDDGGTYGQGLADKVAEVFTSLGGEVTYRGNIDPTQDNYRPVLTNLLANPPGALFFGGYEIPGALLTAQKDEVGLTETVFLGADGTQTAVYIEQAGPSGEGQYSSSVQQSLDDPRLEAFEAEWVEASGGLDYAEYGPYQPAGHDATILILNAIAEVAEVNADGALVIDRAALLEAARNTTDLDGLTGNLTCDEFGDCGAGAIAIWQVQNGEWVQVATYSSDELLGGEAEATPEATTSS